LWSWGFGSGLGLDINYQSSRSSPTQVGTNTNWKNVGSGPYASHVLATDTNNYLYAWGSNSYGQLGTNDRISRSSPVQVSQIGWYTGSLAATSTNSFVNGVGGGGTQIYLYAWGFNGTGELGLNNRVDRSSPTQVGGLDWKNVAAHQNHRMATKSNGTLWLWGQNSYGQLGLNSVSTSYRSSPVQVGTNTDWATIACGYQSNFAIKTNGTLWSWGGNSFGQAGRDDLISRSSPTQIGTNTNWNKIAVGAFTTLLTTSS
jgi:alpha-tubulin suppressor-like RCC1 family protein